MPVTLLVERRPWGWLDVGDLDPETAAMFPVGTRVRFSVTRSKSLDALAFYWALVELVAKATGYTKRALSNELLIRTGTIDALKFKNGEVHAIPRSIAGMDHPEFKEYLDAAVDLICAEYLAECSRSSLLYRVEEMVGINYEATFERKKNGGSRRQRVAIRSKEAA